MYSSLAVRCSKRLHELRTTLEANLAAADQAVLDHIQESSNLPGVEQMEKAVVKAGVLKKTWTVKTKVKADDGLTVEVSSLTGGQAITLIGSGNKGRRPYMDIIEAAVGPCGHNLEDQTEGSFESEFCLQCNMAAIFYQYGEVVYPMIKAMTEEDLDDIFTTRDEDGNIIDRLPWGLLSSRRAGAMTSERDRLLLQLHPELQKEVQSLPPMEWLRPKTGADKYDQAVKKWGRLLVHTYTNGGSRYIISDYCK